MALAHCIESNPDSFDVVHARTLHRFPDLVASLNGDADALMSHAGICTDAESRITYRQISHLLETAAATFHCPDFGMRLAQLQGGGLFGPLGSAMRNSRTFGEAIDYVCTHSYAHSLAARITCNRRPEDGRAFMSHDILLDGIANRAQLMEQTLLVGHLTAMEMTGGHARAWQVHFRHQPISAAKTYRRNFGCEVLFGLSQDGVVYANCSLDSPILAPNAETYRTVTAFIDERFTRHVPPLHAQVRGIVVRLLQSESCTSECIASELNMHIRTLHRKLKGEGTTFQKIKDEVRCDLMLYYLRQTDLDFTHISERLGFAEQSVLTRSCSRWLAASPTVIRAEARQHRHA
ncbi:MAG TPA: AraC family transcriptional regulator ligand-binding domain-containing protein [Sphingobium sp.]|uniref:AraC family transcriptional regulator ligand-binding domain-containing protein n=1 Tax=Sphingobium sp. TaxID=1912891 RepID=UPI002ED11D1D